MIARHRQIVGNGVHQRNDVGALGQRAGHLALDEVAGIDDGRLVTGLDHLPAIGRQLRVTVDTAMNVVRVEHDGVPRLRRDFNVLVASARKQQHESGRQRR